MPYQPKPLHNIALVVNDSKEGANAFADELAGIIASHGGNTSRTSAYPIPNGFIAGADACCVIGGDGTFLSAVPQALAHDVPVFGINQGRLGFLAIYTPGEARNSIGDILRGNYTLNPRGTLECHSANGKHARALNDVVIKHLSPTRVTTFCVHCDGRHVTDYPCDGIIFATPTGSTAYNLAAGGPLLAPEVPVITMTPISPFTLTNRSLILPGDATIEVRCAPKDPIPHVSLDGNQLCEGHDAFPLTIRSSQRKLRLLLPENYDHFHTLRSKLRWGGE